MRGFLSGARDVSAFFRAVAPAVASTSAEAVASRARASAVGVDGVLEMVKQILERLEAHLKAEEFFLVTTNIRAESESEIADQMLQNGIGGLQGPTVSPVFSSGLRSL